MIVFPIIEQTIAEAVGDWYFNRKEAKYIDCPFPCNPSCYNMDFTRGWQTSCCSVTDILRYAVILLYFVGHFYANMRNHDSGSQDGDTRPDCQSILVLMSSWASWNQRLKVKLQYHNFSVEFICKSFSFLFEIKNFISNFKVWFF